MSRNIFHSELPTKNQGNFYEITLFLRKEREKSKNKCFINLI